MLIYSQTGYEATLQFEKAKALRTHVHVYTCENRVYPRRRRFGDTANVIHTETISDEKINS